MSDEPIDPNSVPELDPVMLEVFNMFLPTENDVVLGRGKGFNERYNQLIDTYWRPIEECTAAERRQNARLVVNTIHSRGGRFLKKDQLGLWFEISDEEALLKVRTALRNPNRLVGRQHAP